MRGEAKRKKRTVIHDDCISVLSPFNLQVRFVTRENWFITNVIREICQNSYVKGTMTPPPPYYPLQMKLRLRYFRVVLFLLQRFKKIWIFRFSFFYDLYRQALFSVKELKEIISCTELLLSHQS